MFEVLVFMFENYFAHHAMPESDVMEQELSAAGFERTDIVGAFKWYQEMKVRLTQPDINDSYAYSGTRVFSNIELKKINAESIGFILFSARWH